MKVAGGGFSPLIPVNAQAAKPLHKQIYDGYRALIVDGSLRAGAQIPSTRALAVDLGISRLPVLNAYAQLTAEGYFEGRIGSGTFVSASLPEQLTSCTPVKGPPPALAISGPRPLSRRGGSLPAWTPGRLGRGAFAIGQLAFDQFPFRVWSTLVARRCRGISEKELNYSDPMGVKEFREAIAGYLRTARAVHCDAQQIMVVSGSQQALDLTARVLFDPGDTVWIEDPCYELMRQALLLAGCVLAPVPVDSEGLNVTSGMRRCPQAQAAFVTPSHQYPLGVTMSAPRRLQLLEWANRAGAWIIEDDYDSEYRYENMPIASLQGLDRNARVIYIGTFSKTLFPSLRLGYIVIPADLVDRFTAVRRAMDIFPPSFQQSVMADFINDGHLSRHIRKTRVVYGERRDALVEALRTEFDSFFEILGKEAGLYLTVTLPKGFHDRKIAALAAAQRLWLWPLSPCYADTAGKQGFILGFGGTRAKEMRAAVRRLKNLITPSA